MVIGKEIEIGPVTNKMAMMPPGAPLTITIETIVSRITMFSRLVLLQGTTKFYNNSTSNRMDFQGLLTN